MLLLRNLLIFLFWIFAAGTSYESKEVPDQRRQQLRGTKYVAITYLFAHEFIFFIECLYLTKVLYMRNLLSISRLVLSEFKRID